MNTSLTAYTHLESLLLFQSLHAYGVNPQIFSRVSDLLKNNPTITSDRRFQVGRLSPDALRNFYLQILKDEIKSERQQDHLSESDGQNGDVKNTRKRKAPSPTLPTVQEAAQHIHLLPQLVNKLYARYRTALTHEIRDEEDRFERLQRELESIDRGERDGELVEKANGRTPTPRSPGVHRKSPGHPQKPLPPQSSNPQLAVKDSSKVSPPDGAQHPDFKPPTASAPQNGHAQPPKSPSRIKQGDAPTPQPPLQVPPSPGHVQGTPQPTAHPPASVQPPPQNAPINGPPLHQHRSPYPPQPPQDHSHAPNYQYPPHAQSPIPGAQSRLQHQASPLQTFGGNGVPHYGPPHGPQSTPTHPRHAGPYPPGPQSPGLQTPQQSRNLHPYSGQPPYPPQQPQPGHPPPQGGFMLPPFQVSPQDPARAHQQSIPQYSPVSTPNTRPPPPGKTGPSPAGSMRQGHPPVQPSPYPAWGAFNSPAGLRTPQSGLSTPRSVKTVWKTKGPSTATPSVPRPEWSPIDDVPPLDQPAQAPAKTKAPRKSRAKARSKEKETEKEADPEPPEQPEPSEEQPADPEPRIGRSSRRTVVKRGRPGSIASSRAGGSLRERSRSQSVISHTETVAGDNESQTGTRVKSERGTSMEAVEEDIADTPPQMTTRGRGRHIQATQPKSRKRTAREASLPDSEDQPGTPGLPKTVVAPRHFSRMCVPIMNDIGSHKHASIFSTAVKAKDAEGYYDVIKRPTDLKSIQKAIASGAKAVAAAATDTPTGSPGGGGGIVELPLTPDVQPPKAIVNSAQLEKELMRMFVNAIMFNAGEEGVVEDARQMFEDCQQSVSNWRRAERGRVGGETPVPEEEIVPTASKRRKI